MCFDSHERICFINICVIEGWRCSWFVCQQTQSGPCEALGEICLSSSTRRAGRMLSSKASPSQEHLRPLTRKKEKKDTNDLTFKL